MASAPETASPSPPKQAAENAPSRPSPAGTATPRVAILLSTCNGAAFLPAQLQSFRDQSHANWVLYWRDDGSTDETVAILEQFAAAEARCVRIVDPPGQRVERHPPGRVGGRLSTTASFLALLRAVAPRLAPGDLVAFADQDDVWLAEKLARGVAALAAAEAGVPMLYCARQVLVDARLRRIGDSPRLRRAPGFPASLAQNVAVGCTIMLNPRAIALVAESAPPPATFHDWWCYLLVTAAGGQCLHDDAEVILYRQHPGNAVGSSRSTLRRTLAAMRRGPSAFMGLLRAHLAALAARPDLLSAMARDDVARLQQALRGGMLQRLAGLRAVDLRRQTLAETTLLYLWFLIEGRSRPPENPSRVAARGK